MQQARNSARSEDNLASPLTELDLIIEIGDRSNAESNRRESIYAFRVEDKPEITAELFAYCVNDFWEKRHSNEQTLPFREISVGHGSPGQIFKLPEAAVRDRLETIQKDSSGTFEFQESMAIQQLVRLKPAKARHCSNMFISNLKHNDRNIARASLRSQTVTLKP